MRHSNLQLLNYLLNMLLFTILDVHMFDWTIFITEPVLIKVPGSIGWKVEQVVGNGHTTHKL